MGFVTALTCLVAASRSGPALAQETPAWSWQSTSALPGWRYLHTATALPSGPVLVAGGLVGPTAEDQDRTLLYEPATGEWAEAGRLHAARAWHTATLLPGGEVLLTGGYPPPYGDAMASMERYDPTTGQWAVAGELTMPRAHHSATLLVDGQVLVVGGVSSFPRPSSAVADAELCDPGLGTCSPVPPMAQARHGHAAVLLADGQVLVVGGHDAEGRATATAEIFDPVRAAWRPAGTLRFARYGHTATLLTDGRVLVVGGYDGVTYGLDIAEILDPAHGTWTAAAPSERGWVYHTATLLADGRVLVAGGHLRGYVPVAAATLYDPAADAWTSVGDMISPRGRHSATLLADGRVLVAGGYHDLAVAELFAPPPRRDHRVFLPRALRPDTLAPDVITDTPRRNWQGAVSPDGRSLAYVSEDVASGRSQLHVMDLAARSDAVVPLLADAVDAPTFLGNDRVVLASCCGGDDWGLVVTDFAGAAPGSLRACGQGARRPAATPGFATLFFDAEVLGNRDLYRYDWAEGRCTPLAPHPAPDLGASLAPGDGWLVFRSERDGNSEIYSVGADGSGLTRLTHDPAFDGYPTISPDGRRILFQSRRGGRDGVYVMDADGGNARPILTGDARYATPRFLPAGCGIVYATDAAEPGTERWQVHLWRAALCQPAGGS